ncbi:hypothetical protein [Parachitinimonas caeni]|uniref:Phospholipase D-like protein n=1 Tax=Parachitinimonas caeni TaxID=3031301 RepID=A0ABT7E2X7_9NEIS|nr:hypothetical protein [Parachitinimonas caeni]MDK2126678.1 hypothetical protein [Parachitinimonas caeni]
MDFIRIGRLLSLLVVAFYLWSWRGDGGGGFELPLRGITWMALALAAIWIPEQLGQLSGLAGRRLDKPSPPVLVAILGWIMLILPALMYGLR